MGRTKKKSDNKMISKLELSDLIAEEEEVSDLKRQDPAVPCTSVIYENFATRKESRDKNIKSRNNPCSKWHLKDLRIYIYLDDLRKQDERTNDVILSYSLESIINENLQMFQIDSTKPKIRDVLKKEVNVRIFINSMVQKLCTNLKFGVELEKERKSGDLPNCRFDFLFYNHRKQPIGCLETKPSSKMNDNALAQAVLQLLVLQQFASEENVDVTKVPLFNILTDGQRFVLLQVKGDKLLVEQNEKNHKLKIHRVKEHLLQEQNEESHTDGVMESLYRLIQTSVDASVERPQTT